MSSALRFAGQVRRADELEHDVERAVLLEALGVDRPRAAPSSSTARAVVGVAHRRGDVRAGRAAELDRRGADAAGRAVDEQPLARPSARPA